MSGHVTAKVVWTGEKLEVVDLVGYRAGLRAMNLGAGETLVIRIEREEDAYTYGQIKHYWGHVIRPLSEWNGDFPSDWHLLLKAQFMPEGKTSLTQLNREEMRSYIEQCEVYAHAAHPEAFALYDNLRSA